MEFDVGESLNGGVYLVQVLLVVIDLILDIIHDLLLSVDCQLLPVKVLLEVDHVIGSVIEGLLTSLICYLLKALRHCVQQGRVLQKVEMLRILDEHLEGVLVLHFFFVVEIEVTLLLRLWSGLAFLPYH